MKKLLLILLILFAFDGSAQVTIYPSTGDRFTFYLTNQVWETEPNIYSPFILQVYISPSGWQHVDITNINLTESKFKKFKKFFDSIPGYGTHSRYYINDGSTKEVFFAFDIYADPDKNSMFIDPSIKIDIIDLMNKIRNWDEN